MSEFLIDNETLSVLRYYIERILGDIMPTKKMSLLSLPLLLIACIVGITLQVTTPKPQPIATSASKALFRVTNVELHGSGATVSVTKMDDPSRRYLLNVTQEVNNEISFYNTITLKLGDLLVIQDRDLGSPGEPLIVYMMSPGSGVIMPPIEKISAAGE
jgi:hypothetical protein